MWIFCNFEKGGHFYVFFYLNPVQQARSEKEFNSDEKHYLFREQMFEMFQLHIPLSCKHCLTYINKMSSTYSIILTCLIHKLTNGEGSLPCLKKRVRFKKSYFLSKSYLHLNCSIGIVLPFLMFVKNLEGNSIIGKFPSYQNQVFGQTRSIRYVLLIVL